MTTKLEEALAHLESQFSHRTVVMIEALILAHLEEREADKEPSPEPAPVAEPSDDELSDIFSAALSAEPVSKGGMIEFGKRGFRALYQAGLRAASERKTGSALGHDWRAEQGPQLARRRCAKCNLVIWHNCPGNCELCGACKPYPPKLDTAQQATAPDAKADGTQREQYEKQPDGESPQPPLNSGATVNEGTGINPTSQPAPGVVGSSEPSDDTLTLLRMYEFHASVCGDRKVLKLTAEQALEVIGLRAASSPSAEVGSLLKAFRSELMSRSAPGVTPEPAPAELSRASMLARIEAALRGASEQKPTSREGLYQHLERLLADAPIDAFLSMTGAEIKIEFTSEQKPSPPKLDAFGITTPDPPTGKPESDRDGAREMYDNHLADFSAAEWFVNLTENQREKVVAAYRFARDIGAGLSGRPSSRRCAIASGPVSERRWTPFIWPGKAEAELAERTARANADIQRIHAAINNRAPHDNMAVCVVDWIEEAKAELAELRALLPGSHYESNGEAGDGQTVCDACGGEVDEDGPPHATMDCVKRAVAEGMVAHHLQAELAEAKAKLAEWEGMFDAIRAVISPERRPAPEKGE
ncbi:MAG TPA: hypothetical protein VFR23_24495 [Jiangellaceae bacterium]|nr:hypothetical protein [Jiangellaceae bacterium]